MDSQAGRRAGGKDRRQAAAGGSGWLLRPLMKETANRNSLLRRDIPAGLSRSSTCIEKLYESGMNMMLLVGSRTSRGFFLRERGVFRWIGGCAAAEPTPKELCLHKTFGVVRILSCYFLEPGSAI